MKQNLYLIKKTVVLLAISMLGTSAFAFPLGLCYLGSGTTVRVYEHSDGKGRHIGLNYYIDDLRDYNLNDKVSSVCIRSGHTATLYEHINYGGKRLVLGPGGNHNLTGWWNDRISSIKVD